MMNQAATVEFEGHVLSLSPLQLMNEADSVVSLRPQSLEVLRVLALSADQLVPKDTFFDAVWPDTYASEDSLVQCIREIRRALGQAGPRVIHTEYKRGYRLQSTKTSPIRDSMIRGFKQRVAQTTSRDGLRLAYAVSGSGPMVVRPPHWLTHVDLDWRSGVLGPVLMRLSKEFTVVRMDGRGTGGSERLTNPGTLQDWVLDLQAVMYAEGIERCSLLGVSTGALTAIKYAALFPERIASVALLGGVTRGDLHRGISEQHVMAFSQLIRDGWAMDNPAFRQLMTTSLWPEASAEEHAGFDRLQQACCDGTNAALLLEEIARTTVNPDLRKIKAPTFLLHSLHDQRTPISEAVFASQCLPNSQLLAVNAVNHSPIWSDSTYESSLQELIRFLKSNPGQTQA